MTATASPERIDPLDMPIDIHESKVMYRNGRARMVVTRTWGDDYRPWDDNEGQVPFWIPETDSMIESMANEAYLPGGLDRALYELGSLELVARWLRIFHDNVRIAEACTTIIGHCQGDFAEVLTVVTDEWLDMTGCTVEQVEKETQGNRHLREFAAWAADVCHMLEVQRLHEFDEPESDCDWTDEACCLNCNWDTVLQYTDFIDGPLHSLEDVRQWLEEGAHVVDLENSLAMEEHATALSNGHYAI